MENPSQLKTKKELAQECAPIAYKEIEMFFARGMVILVDRCIDILEVAMVLQSDDAKAMEKLINENKVIRAHDEHARKWSIDNTQLMALTAVPWLLVQEIHSL